MSASRSASLAIPRAQLNGTNARPSRLRTLAHCLALAALATLALGPGSAAAEPGWEVVSTSNTTASPVGHLAVTTLLQGGGTPAVDEVQSLEIDAGAGQVRLAFEGESTPDLPYDPSPSEVQTALEGLPSVGAGNVAVSGGPGLFGPGPFRISFQGSLAAEDVAQIEAAPGSSPLAGRLTYYVDLINRTDTPTSGQITLTAKLPPGITGASYSAPTFDCGNVVGASTINCTTTESAPVDSTPSYLLITAAVDDGAATVRTAEFEASGAGLAPGSTVDPVTVTSLPSGFGIDAFDVALDDAVGNPATAAAADPYVIHTELDFTRTTDPALSPFGSGSLGPNQPVEAVKDVAVELPPGLVGLPSRVQQCSGAQLSNTEVINPRPQCPSQSQVGVAAISVNGLPIRSLLGPVPVFNMVPPPGVPARFGFNVLGTLIILDASVRSESDYGLTIGSRNTSEALAVLGAHVDFWGTPAATDHDAERSCPGELSPGERGTSCASKLAPAAFLRSPTSCIQPGQGLTFTARINSWEHPETSVSRSVRTHAGPGYPYPEEDWGPEVGIEGCDEVPFEPGLNAAPTNDRADSPAGLDLDLSLPQSTDPHALGQADLRRAVITLPQGMTLNPSAASGLASCGVEQVGLIGTDFPEPYPIHFTPHPAHCPDTARIGDVEIETPALDHPLKGAIYLGSQGDNPFGSLLAMYLIVNDPSGVVLKLPGLVQSDPQTGWLTTTFDSNPQLPFSNLHVSLFGGPRAALRTPAACGTYTTTATLTPWSGNPAVTDTSSFQVTQGCGGGFDPHLDAGTENPLAGATSPFNLRLSRNDASQELSGLHLTLPPGLSGYLAGIPYCPDATLSAISGELGTGVGQEQHPSCPAASQVGTVTVGAGSGPNPFYTSSARAYLAGPYKGAPLSIAVVAPAVAGPFDLGSVVVRNAVHIDQATAQLSVDSDPLPTILHGIPLDLRDVRVMVNRNHFTLNPTNCDPLQVASQITSTEGQTATPAVHFQVSGCDRLGFKPKLALKLKGKVNRTAHPSLTATYAARPGDANLARAQVKLPPSALLDNAHIGTICTRPQFAAHACPPKSVYGTAQATSPILGYPLKGSVYLRSSAHKLPDLIADLRGPDTQPIEVALAGKTDSVKGALRNTFEVLPDAPVTKFTLKLFGGKKGLIEMGSGFCAHPNAAVSLVAQNNRARELTPRVVGKCKHRRTPDRPPTSHRP